jgi:aminomethyltransferase
MSPSMNGIGLGYVTIANTAVDSDIYIRIRKNDVLAKVVKLPFYKSNLVSTKYKALKFFEID